MYGAKAKGSCLSKLYKNIYGIASQKFELFLNLSMKNRSQMKSFQSIVITLVRGHICSLLQVKYVIWLRTSRVWLDWIDHWNFILVYRLVHTWSTHTTVDTQFYTHDLIKENDLNDHPCTPKIMIALHASIYSCITCINLSLHYMH